MPANRQPIRPLLSLPHLLLLCILTLGLYSPAPASRAQQTLIIGTEHYPPYEMEQPVDGLRGFDYEVVSRIFEQLNRDIDIRFYPWKRVLAYAQKGEVVGIMTCAYSQERESFISYSDPISHYNDGFYIRKDFTGKPITNLTDFIGTNVASVDGYESLTSLQAAGATPMSTRTTEMAVNMLAKHRFDYLYLGKQATDFVIKKLGMTENFRYLSLKQQYFYFCFSKAHPQTHQLIERFNRALAQLKASGEYDLIHAKYR